VQVPVQALLLLFRGHPQAGGEFADDQDQEGHHGAPADGDAQTPDLLGDAGALGDIRLSDTFAEATPRARNNGNLIFGNF